MAVLIVTLNACSGLTQSDKPATTTWWLEPYTNMLPVNTTEPPLLLGISVGAIPGLDTNRILTLSEKAELNHYRAARWVDNLPELVTSLTGRTLESSGRFKVVSAHTGGGPESCSLHLELQAFFAELSPSGQTNGVTVALNGSYQCESANAVPLYITAAIPVYDERMNLIVAAFQQAMDSVMQDLLGQLENS